MPYSLAGSDGCTSLFWDVGYVNFGVIPIRIFNLNGVHPYSGM